MKKRNYSRPDFGFVHNRGTLPMQQIASLSDERLQSYLHESGFWRDRKRYRANPDYLLREIVGENILIPVNDSATTVNCMFSLNETCLYLWKEFQRPHTVDDIVIHAKREFDASEEQLEQDIRAFVTDYLQAGLLKEAK